MDKGISKDILIVEDDMIIAMVLERMLQKIGHHVIDKVISGQQAIKKAVELTPDLILMDIQLKDHIDGISAMQTILEQRDIPVIYITGNSDKFNLSRAKKTRFTDYLVKPIQMRDLAESVAKAFN